MKSVLFVNVDMNWFPLIGCDVDNLVVVVDFLEALFLITSVFNESGRVVPCNLRNNPQALHNVFPSASFLQRGVFKVLQLKHSVGFWAAATPLGVEAVDPGVDVVVVDGVGAVLVVFDCGCCGTCCCWLVVLFSFNLLNEEVKFDFCLI